MSQSSVEIKVDFDSDEEEVVINFTFGDYAVAHRLRPLHGWLLLYILDPDSFENNPEAEEFCEKALAYDPPIGFMGDGESLLISLPSGHFIIPESKSGYLRDALAKKLVKYTEGLGFDYVHDGQHRHGHPKRG